MTGIHLNIDAPQKLAKIRAGLQRRNYDGPILADRCGSHKLSISTI